MGRECGRSLLRAVVVFVWALAPFHPVYAAELEMTRIGARTDRPSSTIEARGELQSDDPEGLLGSIEADGLSVRFEYTSTVSDPGFMDGDLIPGTDFTWEPHHCKVSKNRTKVTCNDKQRKTYIKLSLFAKAGPNVFKLKSYVRRITPPLFITPNVGEEVRFVVDWTDATSGLPASLSGVMDRCDWKRGPQRTARHLKCPTLCGGSERAVCGSNYCVDSPKCR